MPYVDIHRHRSRSGHSAALSLRSLAPSSLANESEPTGRMLKWTRPLASKPCSKFAIDQCQTVIHELRSFPADVRESIDLTWLSVAWV